ncbi:MAG: PilN domain-containing protein [Gammaproteobacteria bacterium]|nr:PilN domain-containing protein [Gammaproteobacteria bacterium]
MPHINLLPWREELRTAKKRQFNTAMGGAAIVTALAVVFVHIQMTSMITSQNQRNQFLENTIKQVEKEIEEIRDLKNAKENLLARMEVIQKLQSSRPEIVHLFEEIANATPKGVFLLDTSRNGDKLTITGVADSNDSVSAFMRNLDASEWLSNPKLSVIDSSKKEYENSSWFNLEVTQTAPSAKSPAQAEEEKA